MEDLTLRQIRLAREISCEKMASLIGVHPNTYRKWEQKPSGIAIDFAYKICEILGVEYQAHIFLP